LERRLEAAGAGLGLEIPGGAWADWGFATCENPIDTNLLMTTADDLVVWAQDGIPASAQTTLSAAQILWENTQLLCPEVLSEEERSAGPPTQYEFPRCTVPTPFALPWSEEVGEPTEESLIDGVVEASWLGPAYYTGLDGREVRQEMNVLVGRGETFRRTAELGQPFGEIRGATAYLVGYDATDTSAVEVGWASSGRWCDAVVVRLNPDPLNTPVPGSEVTDLVQHIETLLFPPHSPSLNEAESIIIPAVESLQGATSLGGEPAHGGPGASMAFQIGNDEYWVYAVPDDVDSEVFDLGNPVDEATVGETDVSIHNNDGTSMAVFDQAGLTIGVGSSTAPQSSLLEAAALMIESIDQITGQT
jgi:hypothetical protein